MGRAKKVVGACHLAEVKRTYKGTTYTTTLLRRTFREAGKVKHETLGNLTHLPPQILALVKRSLAGEPFISATQGLRIERTKSHGHVAAVLGTLRKVGPRQLLSRAACKERELVCAMLVARVIEARSDLATAGLLSVHAASSTLGEELGIEYASEEDVYRALDWLLERKDAIESELSQRHLRGATVPLYDLSSTYFEGQRCELGVSRDGLRARPQVVFGLVCDERGCPVAIEAFEDKGGDAAEVRIQIKKMRGSSKLERVVVVGDCGALTGACIGDDLASRDVDWVSALRARQVRKLMEEGSLQLSMFGGRDFFEIDNPHVAGERLVACRNPALGEERRRSRGEILDAAEKELDVIRAAASRSRRPLRGKEEIGSRAGQVLARTKMGKYFKLTIADDGFEFRRKHDSIERESALDGIHVIRTSVPACELSTEATIASYKQLSNVERAFRGIRTVVNRYHYTPDRVRAHAFLCMLAYYVEWHMRETLAPMLLDEEEARAEVLGQASIAQALPAPSQDYKAEPKRPAEESRVLSFRSLLLDLATIAKNRVVMVQDATEQSFTVITSPTTLQQRALSLLGIGLLF